MNQDRYEWRVNLMIYSSVLGSLYFLTSYLQVCLRTEDAVEITAVLIHNTCILSYEICPERNQEQSFVLTQI